MLPAKRVLQRTCQLKLQWDEKLPDDLLRSWTKWREQLELLNQVNIPRCYFPDGWHAGKSFQLHHFSDASEIILLALSFNFCNYINNISCKYAIQPLGCKSAYFINYPSTCIYLTHVQLWTVCMSMTFKCVIQ